jgi:hypothetical protein
VLALSSPSVNSTITFRLGQRSGGARKHRITPCLEGLFTQVRPFRRRFIGGERLQSVMLAGLDGHRILSSAIRRSAAFFNGRASSMLGGVKVIRRKPRRLRLESSNALWSTLVEHVN